MFQVGKAVKLKRPDCHTTTEMSPVFSVVGRTLRRATDCPLMSGIVFSSTIRVAQAVGTAEGDCPQMTYPWKLRLCPT